MGFFSEFKEFAMRGNVMDMAVGIIIGGAFGGIVKSAVDDVIMPPIGYLMGGTDFSGLVLSLGEAPDTVDVRYGAFIQTIINFLIIALAIFMMIKVMNSLQKQEEEAPEAPPEPTGEEKLLGEIRDLLAKQ